jgi:hypothetical protein
LDTVRFGNRAVRTAAFGWHFFAFGEIVPPSLPVLLAAAPQTAPPSACASKIYLTRQTWPLFRPFIHVSKIILFACPGLCLTSVNIIRFLELYHPG